MPPTDPPEAAVHGKTTMGGVCELVTPGSLSACTLVIFGASGDLTARKLIPAFYSMHLSRNLPEPFTIVGSSRTVFTNEEFREKLRKATIDDAGMDAAGWSDFAARLYYQPVTYDSPETFTELSDFLKKSDRLQGTGGNRIFYLAVPPALYPVIAEMIGQAGLSQEGENGSGWARIVVEKPFGRDLKTAMELDDTLHRSFAENQIFRIDHYLAKETVQNILMFRFANTIFEPVWNRNYIDYVGILAAEELGVENRAGYYEEAGVIRDMFQNHMFQLLALTAMEPPSFFDADRVRLEKGKVGRSLKPLGRETLFDNLIVGQYQAGVIDGVPEIGYREEPGVDPGSITPTFAMMRLFVDNWRWQGVPFYLASGKKLARKETKIVIQFKGVPHSMFRNVLDEKIVANRLVLGIYPEEEITITFQTKVPGAKSCLRPVDMDFMYYQGFQGSPLDAYSKVLLDVILGDQMLFWHNEGVKLAWRYLTPILEECETCANPEALLYPYKAGSWGPVEALKWMSLIVD
ncbi:MAG: glucose-6-phosphate dehydrogenase [Desulfobulbales bacterium]|nr:glucose-6-phosphate dehydrogenase [Desulfobulbales bacterium]